MIHLAFHDGAKATSPNGRLFDWLIRLRTGSDITHVEMVFGTPDHDTLCFSSVPGAGVRFAYLDLTLPCWQLVALPQVPAGAAHSAAARYLGQKYDWLGVALGVGVPWGLHDDHDKFCNEVCLDVLQDLGFYEGPKPWRLSPAGLFELVTR